MPSFLYKIKETGQWETMQGSLKREMKLKYQIEVGEIPKQFGATESDPAGLWITKFKISEGRKVQ